MQFSVSLIDILVISLAGAAVLAACITSWFLLTRYPTFRRANYFFVLLLAALVVFEIAEALIYGNVIHTSIRTAYLPIDYTWLYGPALYFSVRRMVHPEDPWKPKYWLHFILPVLQPIYLIVLTIGGASLKEWFWINVDQPWFSDVDNYYTAFAMLAYGTAAWRYMHNTQPKTKTLKLAERWLNEILLIFLGCGMLLLVMDMLVPDLVGIFTDYSLWNARWYKGTVTLIYSLAIAITCFRTLIFNQMADHYVAQNTRKEDYAIAPDQLGDYATQLTTYLEQEKPYLDSGLTLQSTADALDIPARHLSYVINEKFDQNFSELINTYRVQAACEILTAPGNNYKSVLDIGLEAGFSSKSTFNRVFKQVTGQTPSQYRSNA